ncbi:hypothetical protein [Tepidibacillus marianensis]|uniref:hypothetical protein n=1 Tax=Tepidibacillus marianensis TaxID=3131995 RepID=UPI0030D0E907
MHQSKKEMNLKLWNQLTSFDFQDQLASEEIRDDIQLSREIDPFISSTRHSGEQKKR